MTPAKSGKRHGAAIAANRAPTEPIPSRKVSKRSVIGAGIKRGIVDEGIYSPKCLERRLYQSFDLIRPADIGSQRQDFGFASAAALSFSDRRALITIRPGQSKN